ncbi:hypothetical protein AAZX31_11G127600 [Glycine max]
MTLGGVNNLYAVFLPLPFNNEMPRRIYQTNMAGSGLQDSNEAASVGIVEDSAREVPTGPDPLHHINHPIGH